MGLLDLSSLQRINDPNVRRLVIGLSGGVDSMVLLHLVSTLLKTQAETLAESLAETPAPEKSLLAVHVNHGLQPAAAEFEAFCRETCASLNVDLTVMRAEVETSGSLETNARTARYAIFESLLETRDLLLLAHHADDQAETVLFRMMRGSRLAGLDGIPAERPLGAARLFRPLLGIRREAIVAYAREAGIEWINDPTNDALHADRNFIRHQVLPLLESRWPAARERLIDGFHRDARMRHRSQQQLLEQLAGIRSSPDSLVIEALAALDPDQLPDLLDAWLLDLALPLLSNGLLGEVVRRLQESQTVDVVTSQLEFREHQGRLYVLLPVSRPDLELCQLSPAGLSSIDSRISSRTLTGQGLKVGPDYSLRYRQGGETLRLAHTRTLKYLFQAYHVPVWIRSAIPLVFSGDELVAIAGLPDWQVPMLIADGWRATGSLEGHVLEISLGDRCCADSRE